MTKGGAYRLAKSFLGDIRGSQSHPALVSIGNAEHDAQLQVPHQLIAAVSLEDVLPRLREGLCFLVRMPF